MDTKNTNLKPQAPLGAPKEARPIGWMPEEPIRPLERLMCHVDPRERIDELETWDIATAHNSNHWRIR